MTDGEARISAARQMFEAAFAERTFYEKQTRDDAHLQAILRFVPVTSGLRVLDLGTGSGYLAFAFAKAYPDAFITGLDITEAALEQNRQRAAESGIGNLRFVSYDGGRFPFDDCAFDLVVSRYVLHHFPDIAYSLSEVSRVLSRGGRLFISDPAPDESDTGGFADAFMQVKPDGHRKFYAKEEWLTLCIRAGFVLTDAFESKIRFPRKNEPAYQEIIRRFGAEAAALYDVTVTGDEIYITEQVNNLLFQKQLF